MSDIRALLTIKKLAEALNVSSGTIYYWVSRNEIPYLKVGRHLRFDLEEVQAYFAEQTELRRKPCPSPMANVSRRRARRSLKTQEIVEPAHPSLKEE